LQGKEGRFFWEAVAVLWAVTDLRKTRQDSSHEIGDHEESDRMPLRKGLAGGEDEADYRSSLFCPMCR